MVKYVEGEIVEQFGSTYRVEKVYQVSDAYMEEHDLHHKNRVALKKVKGNGSDDMDFAIVD